MMHNSTVVKSVLLIVSVCLSLTGLGYDLHSPLSVPIREKAKPAGGDMRFVEKGALRFAIVIDGKAETRAVRNFADKSIAPAVAYLCDEIEKVMGKRPEIVDETDAAKLAAFDYRLVVGDSETARANGVDARALPDQAFAVKTFPKGIIVAGNDSSIVDGFNDGPKMRRRGSSLGTLYGAIDFVQRFLEVRYFFPGEYGTYRPRIADLTIAPVHYEDQPYFNNHLGIQYQIITSLMPGGRAMQALAPYLGKVPKASEWERLWRCGGTNPMGGGHSPEPHWFGREHPDKLETIFYTSPNGKRWYHPTAYAPNYYNVVNLELADILLADWKKAIDTDGKWNLGGNRGMSNIKSLYFGCTDVMMQSRDMKDDPVVKKLGLMPDELIARGEEFAFVNVYGRFHKYLAERVKETWPDAKVWYMAYYNCYRAPTDPQWNLPDNVELVFCARDFPCRTRSAKCVARAREMMGEWYRTLGNRPIQRLWLYGDRFNRSARAIAGEFMGDIPKVLGKYLGRDGAIIYDYDAQPGDVWFYYYSTWAAMMGEWNPDFDADAAIDAHWPLLYGEEAGRHLCRFHRLLKEAYLKYYVDSDSPYPQYPVSYVDEMEYCLRQAEAALAPDSVEMKRFRLMSAKWPEEFAKRRLLAAYVPPVYKAKKVAKGTVRDAAFWEKIPSVVFMNPRTGELDKANDTKVKFAWDEENVYVHVDGDYPPNANEKTTLWENDHVELFLSPGLGKETKYMFAFDPCGHVFTQFERLRPVPQPPDSGWRPAGLAVDCRKTSARWQADAVWPFAGMEGGAPKSGAEWNLNVARTVMSPSGAQYVIGSALTSGYHHDVNMYGILKFE